MTQCGLWMDGKWVKTPLTPLERNQVKWGSSGTYLSGGGYAVNSATSHYEISAQWMGTQDELDPIIESLEHGEDFHMVDPFARKNILPEWLANPWYMAQDAPSFTTTRPSGASNRQGAEFDSAGTKTFTVSVPDSSNVPIPGPPVVVAKNLCPNPTAIAGGAIIGIPNTENFTITRGVTVPATPNGTTTASQCQAPAGEATILSVSNADGIGNSTTPRTIKMQVRSNVAFDFRFGFGAWVYTNLAPDQWHTVTGTTATGFTVAQSRRAGGAPTQATDRIWWTDITTDEDFFTGDTPNTDTYQYAWADAPHNSPSTKYSIDTSQAGAAAFLFEGTASITVNGAPAVSGVPLPVPTGNATIALTGGGTIDYMVLSTLGLPTGRVRGRGYSKVKCTGWTVTGYTAAEEIERIGLSATFVEVGGWN